MLINDILDLSKIESGTVVVDVGELRSTICTTTSSARSATSPRPRASTSSFDLDPKLPGAMFTDPKRLQQILKNLLSNAFKFTHAGQVTLAIEPGDAGWNRENERPEPRVRGRRILGDGHRHRHLARQAADHLRGLSAGRRQHQPQVRRHGPGPGHQPRALAPARRRDPARQRAARRQHVHALSAHRLHAAVAPGPGRRRGTTVAGAVPGSSAASAIEATAEAGIPIADADGKRHAEGEAGANDGAGPFPRSNGSSAKWATTAMPSSRATTSCSIVENDVAFARLLLETARETGFKGIVATRGRGGPGSRRAVQAVGHHARSLPSRYRRLARPEQAEARCRDPAHSGRRHFDGRRPRTGASSGALRFVAKPIQNKEVLERMLTDVKRFIGPPEGAC